MYCSRCRHSGKQSGEWVDSPCSRCTLVEDSTGTLPYIEDRSENGVYDPEPEDAPWTQEPADNQTPRPFARLEGDEADPLIPISVLADALSLWLRLSLPARKVIQLRMAQIPYSEIGRRLGCSRQAAEKLVAQALAREPLLGNLLPAKSGREAPSLAATRTSAIAGRGRTGKGAKTAQ